jgi:hypothetical protein
MLSEISEELRNRSALVVSGLVQKFPIENLSADDSLDSLIEDGIVYEIAFDGTDSDAELLEKKTGLILLGVSEDKFSEERPCLVSGNLTLKRSYIARMY